MYYINYVCLLVTLALALSHYAPLLSCSLIASDMMFSNLKIQKI